jgi:hypothetical protein
LAGGGGLGRFVCERRVVWWARERRLELEPGRDARILVVLQQRKKARDEKGVILSQANG